MALNVVTLTWDITDLVQAGQQARILLTPTAVLTDPVDHLVIPEVTKSVAFVGGTGSLPGVIATDNSQIEPAGWAYTIQIVDVNGRTIVPPFNCFIAYASGATQDLSTLAPVSPVATMAAYLPLPSGIPTSGQVPVSLGSGTATQWGTASGGINPPAGDLGGTASNPTVVSAHLAAPLPIAQGGTSAASASAALTALGAVPVTAEGAASGVATLDSSAVVTRAQLPLAGSTEYPSSVGPFNTVGSSTDIARADHAHSGGSYALLTNNLSDLTSPATARVNLGLAWKDPAAVCQVGALPANSYSAGVLTATSNGVLTVDSVTAVAGMRVVVTGESAAANNGIYTVTQAGSSSTPYILTRAADMATGTQVPGAMVMVEEGTNEAASGWVVAGTGPVTIGTTAIFWTRVTAIISGNNPQPLGTATPGVTGFVSDAGHVHQVPAALPPNGAASGDLGGTYPSPTVTGTHLASPLPIAQGGTGQATAAAAFNSLNPMTTLGDIAYESAANTASRLAGNTTTTKNFLVQTGTGSVSAAPSWGTIVSGDLPAGTTGAQGALQLDGTAADIAAAGTQTAGAIGKAADSGHIHPATSWLAGDQGFLTWTFDPAAAGSSSTLTAGTLYLVKLPIRNNLTITNIIIGVSTAGSGSSTGSFVGLYSSSGSLLSGSSDIGASMTPSGLKTLALTTAQSVTAGSFVWAAVLVNLASTQPTLGQSGIAASWFDGGLTAATYRWAVNGTGLTSLPASITPSSNTTAGAHALWIAAS